MASHGNLSTCSPPGLPAGEGQVAEGSCPTEISPQPCQKRSHRRSDTGQDALQRLTRQRERLLKSITARKNRIGSVIDGYLPGLRRAFSDQWSRRARAFYHRRLNPFTVVRDGQDALNSLLAGVEAEGALAESYRVYQACQNLVEFYEKSRSAGMVNEDFFDDLQEEVACELRLMEADEAEAERVSSRIEELYRRLHANDHLRTIPGVGEHTAPVFWQRSGIRIVFVVRQLLLTGQVWCPGQTSHRRLRAKG